MQTVHPIHSLRRKLETARLELVQRIASDDVLSAEALRELSIIQGSLMAVREEIGSHDPKIGSGAEEALD